MASLIIHSISGATLTVNGLTPLTIAKFAAAVANKDNVHAAFPGDRSGVDGCMTTAYVVYRHVERFEAIYERGEEPRP